MYRISRKSIRFLYIAFALVAFAVFNHYLGSKLWPDLAGVFLFISVVGLAVLLVVPLAVRGLGFYREGSLKQINDAMKAEEEWQSGKR